MTSGTELQDQGTKLFMQHEYEAAADIFKQAQGAYAADGKNDLAAEMQVNIGLIERALGNYDNAIKLMTEARQVFSGMSDKSREAQVVGNLGGVYLSQGNSEQAVTLRRENQYHKCVTRAPFWLPVGDDLDQHLLMFLGCGLILHPGHLYSIVC